MAEIIKQSDNSLIPGQPEYGKGWKSENNHGCCPNCKEPEVPVCTTKTQLFTRGSQSDSLVFTVTNRYCKCQRQPPFSGCQDPVNSVDCSSNNI